MARPVFGPESATFLADLAKHNDRDWFTAHRADYDALVRGPMETLLGTVTDVYGPGRVTRPNRDVRFSADKTPYKTTSSMWAGTVGGVYLQLDAEGIEVGGGLYEPTRDQLARAREAIDGRPEAATRLEQITTDLERHGFALAGPSLTTAPRGYPRDHPRIELLRLRHYAALTRLDVDADLPRIRREWERVQPLIDWSEEYVGPARSWP